MSDQKNDWSDDVISLEDLVSDAPAPALPTPSPEESVQTVAGAPVPPPTAPEAKPAPAEAAPKKAGVAFDISDLDKALDAEDPGFAASLGEVKAEGGIQDVDIDSLDLSEVIREQGLKGWRKIVLVLFKRPLRRMKDFVLNGSENIGHLKSWLLEFSKSGGKTAIGGLKHGVTAAIAGIKGLLARFMALPGLSKAMIAGVVVLAIALFFVVRVTFRGDFMPEMGAGFLNSFADIADKKFEYAPEEPMEEFNNPALQPESVVLLDKVVVNLKRTDDGSNPMGMFEIYVEAATHEAAVELKDREIEARDTVSRTLEQISYDEIITPEGKNKLKLILRKDLNAFLTQGRVRKIYFKSMVLKP